MLNLRTEGQSEPRMENRPPQLACEKLSRQPEGGKNQSRALEASNVMISAYLTSHHSLKLEKTG